jgi:hypothetical protein
MCARARACVRRARPCVRASAGDQGRHRFAACAERSARRGECTHTNIQGGRRRHTELGLTLISGGGWWVWLVSGAERASSLSPLRMGSEERGCAASAERSPRQGACMRIRTRKERGTEDAHTEEKKQGRGGGGVMHRHPPHPTYAHYWDEVNRGREEGGDCWACGAGCTTSWMRTNVRIRVRAHTNGVGEGRLRNSL